MVARAIRFFTLGWLNGTSTSLYCAKGCFIGPPSQLDLKCEVFSCVCSRRVEFSVCGESDKLGCVICFQVCFDRFVWLTGEWISRSHHTTDQPASQSAS